MKRGTGRLVVVAVAVIFVIGMVGGQALADCTCVNNDCYEDVIVSGAGTIQVNGTHVFNGMLNGKPRYTKGILAEIYYTGGGWIVTSGGHAYGQISSASTPPATGWQLAGGAAPAPTLSGGESCASRERMPLQIVPLGTGGEGVILDRVQTATRTEPVGTESFRLLDIDGSVTCVSPLHLCVFETDYSTTPPTRTLIDYRFIPCDPVTGTYNIDIPLYALLSSTHDVVLTFADEPVLDTYGLPSVGAASSGASPDSEDAPMAIYEVGETITGRCQILIGGMPSVTSYIHLYFYSIDLSTRPVTLGLLDHWVVRCGSGTSIYNLEIATDRLPAGDYSIRLAFEDGSTEDLQIRLVEPPT